MCHGQMIGDAILKARKPHRCDDCACLIQPGKLYQRQVSSDGGELRTWKGCKTCAALNSVKWGETDGYNDDFCYTDPRDDVSSLAKANGWRWMLAEARKASARLFSRGGGGA